MKTIGLLGGMSWESTVTYYQLINEGVKKALGGLHSAKILLYSVEFAQIEEMQAAGEWDKAAQVLCDAPTCTYDHYQQNVKPKPQQAKKTTWVCKVCGYVYEGEELPDDFICPLCKHGKEDFEKIEA